MARFVAVMIGVVALMLALTWVVQGNEFFLYQYFAPKFEQVRRTTFEQTKSYNQGMIQELENMMFEYNKAGTTTEQQTTLAGIILHRAADYDENRLPANLREFVQKLRRERMATR